MIKSVQIFNANNKLINEVNFKKGVNYIISESSYRKNKNDNKKSRNGTGKSSLIDIIDYCLGKDKSNFLEIEQLENWTFSLEIEINNKIYKIYRSLEKKSKDRIYIEDNDFSEWIIQPKQNNDTANFYLKLKYWRIVLGNLFFNINDEEEKINYYPSYRGLIRFFIRNGKGAYLSPFSTFEKEKDVSIQVSNSFLLNLDWEYAIEFQKLKDNKKTLDQLKLANKAGLLSGYSGKIGELEAEKISLDNKISAFEQQLASFKVLPQYEEIRNQTDEYTKEIHNLNNQIIFDNALLEKYKETNQDEQDIDLEIIQSIYNEAGLIFPDKLTRNIKDIINFHKTIVNNRREYLDNEINSLKNKIVDEKSKIESLTEKRAKNFEILNTHNALEEYTKLSSRLSELKQQLINVENNIKNLKTIENNSAQIKKDRIELFQKARLDLEERREQKLLAMSTFLEIANILYDDTENNIKSHIGLTIDITDTGYKFDAYIGKDSSDGRSAMRIFDYDFTIMKINSFNHSLQDWLVHDSRIFDPVDERQIANAIRYAHKVTSILNTQYICAINSDRIPYNLFSEQDKINFEESICLKLKDSENGGLFKIRF